MLKNDVIYGLIEERNKTKIKKDYENGNDGIGAQNNLLFIV